MGQLAYEAEPEPMEKKDTIQIAKFGFRLVTEGESKSF